MPEAQLHSYLVLAMLALAAITLVALFRITAPYGRHLRPGWGPTIPARLGWIIMESPAVILFIAIYSLGDNAGAAVPMLFLGVWLFHYLNRTFVFPFRLHASAQRMPVSVVAMAIAFNCLNAYVNARWISHLGSYEITWLQEPAFIAGAACFIVGWTINQHADTVLIRLRQRNDAGYAIPRGGLYRWISCPNYLGEVLEWTGWAIATWSLAGTAFAVFTAANLVPRAIANHRWYQQQFANYPTSRRAIIPFML